MNLKIEIDFKNKSINYGQGTFTYCKEFGYVFNGDISWWQNDFTQKEEIYIDVILQKLFSQK